MTNQAVNRINGILAKFDNARYLEIGVFKGLTFFGIEAASKFAVDPKFLFDVPEDQEGCQFHEMYSDLFFEALNPESQFDVIFIDGLHTFEQTFRDLCNALQHIHSRSIIVIDDTVPDDAYSIHRNQAEAVAARHDSGKRSGSWHGDTFKVVFALHDYFPWLNYATIMDDGNPQTIVWVETRKSAPAFDRVEQIGHADFFTFRDHRALFNPVSKVELEAILAARFPELESSGVSEPERPI